MNHADRPALLRIALVFSLAANAYLVGVCVGDVLKEREQRSSLPPVSEITKQIPEWQRTRFRNLKDWLQKVVAEERDQIRAKYEELFNILIQDEFIAEDYRNKEEEIIELRASIQRVKAYAISELASGLSKQDRQKLAKALQSKQAK